MSYNGEQIIEVLVIGENIWSKTTLRDWYFALEGVMGYSPERMRLIEGSVDGGLTWKIRYENELARLGVHANDLQWRVKT